MTDDWQSPGAWQPRPTFADAPDRSNHSGPRSHICTSEPFGNDSRHTYVPVLYRGLIFSELSTRTQSIARGYIHCVKQLTSTILQ